MPTTTTAPALTAIRPAEFDAGLAARRQSLIAGGRVLAADEAGYYLDVQEARLRQISGTGLRVTRREQQVILELPGQLTFDVGSARLSARAMTALASVAKVLVDYRLSVITVHGHTDDSGNAAQNQALSEQRALAVARQLISEGVTADRIIVVGHGAASPVVANTSPEGREANRRVELRVEPLVP